MIEIRPPPGSEYHRDGRQSLSFSLLSELSDVLQVKHSHEDLVTLHFDVISGRFVALMAFDASDPVLVARICRAHSLWFQRNTRTGKRLHDILDSND